MALRRRDRRAGADLAHQFLGALGRTLQFAHQPVGDAPLSVMLAGSIVVTSRVAEPRMATVKTPFDPMFTGFGQDPGLMSTLTDCAYLVEKTCATVLLGLSGQPGSFDERVVRAMSANCGRPLIFPLSNPTSLAEALPEDIYRWSGGNALCSQSIRSQRRQVSPTGTRTSRFSRSMPSAYTSSLARDASQPSPMATIDRGACQPPYSRFTVRAIQK